jgi:oligopeptide transport system substrate-binding protein
LESSESKVYYDQLKNRSYQLGIGSWFADFRDPISFLEIFKLKDNGTNNTQWENPKYIDLLNQSALAQNNEERNKLLKQAERTIINEMPIIPLFYSSYNYVRNPIVKDVYFSELGYLDFKHAYLDTEGK